MRIIATATYERDAKRLLKGDEQMALEQAIADDPEAHPVIPGTNGVRKARWARQGSGKSGGVRVIYYHWWPAPRFTCWPSTRKMSRPIWMRPAERKQEKRAKKNQSH